MRKLGLVILSGFATAILVVLLTKLVVVTIAALHVPPGAGQLAVLGLAGVATVAGTVWLSRLGKRR
jgi:hypothetical protein